MRDDAEIVGHRVSEVLPLEGDGLAEKRDDYGCELGLGFVESIMSDVIVHDYITQWLWTYNNDRLNIGIGSVTPAMKLTKYKMAA